MIIDRWGNILTLTDMEVVRSDPGRVMKFNGSTSKIDAGDPDDLVGDKTFIVWVKLYSYGTSLQPRIIDNGKLIWFLNSADNSSRFSSDGGGTIYTITNQIDVDSWQMFSAVRTSAGLVSIYKNAVLIGTANQDSGTPVEGTTNLIIGNRNASDKIFHGLIEPVVIKNRILTAAEISQIYTESRQRYSQ